MAVSSLGADDHPPRLDVFAGQPASLQPLGHGDDQGDER
jgi:hypothetical protein